MWAIQNYNSKAVAEWMNDHLEKKVFKYPKPIVLPNTPFVIEITSEIYKELKEIYVNYEEHGGIIFCQIICLDGKTTLKAVKVVEIPNVYLPCADRPGRTRANSYLPDAQKYISAMENVFSLNEAKSLLFPIHFHTHPTKDEKEELEYYNAFKALNTSGADKNAALNRYVKFQNVKLRYMNAIITGHDDTHNILIYAPEVTPLDFLKVKMNRVMKSFSEGGEAASELTKNEGGKVAIKVIAQIVGLTSMIAFYGQLDYYTQLFGDNEYFTTLIEEESTIIRIPIYTEGDVSPFNL